MKIIVCIKRVPDTTAKIKIQADGKDIEKEEAIETEVTEWT